MNCDAEVDRILELDKARRDIIFATEQMKAEQNKVSCSLAYLAASAAFFMASAACSSS